MSKHGGPFNVVGGLRPKRHFFDLSHSKLFTLKCGELFPALALEVLPGDKFKISNSIVVRTQPLIAPILQTLRIYTEYFFVPNRILWDEWDDFITGGKDGTYSETPPLWNNASSGQVYAKDTLADSMGFPIGVTVPIDDVPTAFFQMAYNRIWNEYYRDETIDDEVSEFNNSLLKRRWKRDYFTSALPFPQRGAMQSVPVNFDETGSGYFKISADVVPGLRFVSSNSGTRDSGNTPLYGYQDTASTTTNQWVGFQFNNIDPIGKRFGANNGSGVGRVLESRIPSGTNIPGSYVASGAGGFTIADLRLSVQIQKFLERNMRAGYRLNEFLLAHFGLAPRDSVLQRPEYIGGSRSNIVVSEVLQTSQTTTGEDASPQGNLAGRGISASSEYISTYTFSEHGILLGLCSIMPQNLYDSQGVHKMFSRRSRYDYYFPEFAHLSEQPIYTRELRLTDGHATNMTIFGYQPIYQEYRHMRSQVLRDFRVGQALDYWTMARSFAYVPTLSSAFLSVDPPIDRVVAVNTFAPFMVHFGNIVKAFRPIPVLGEPGLVDHF